MYNSHFSSPYTSSAQPLSCKPNLSYGAMLSRPMGSLIVWKSISGEDVMAVIVSPLLPNIQIHGEPQQAK